MKKFLATITAAVMLFGSGGIFNGVDRSALMIKASADDTYTVITENQNKVFLEDMPIIESDQYADNEGDSFVYKIGEHKYSRGNTDIDGESYSHGIEAWIARWNYKAESSWAYSVFDINGKYKSLSGKCVLIKSYNTTNFDTTLEFYGDGELIKSYRMTPDTIPFDIKIDVTEIKELKVYAYDNKAVCGGTSFGLTDMLLSSKKLDESELEVIDNKTSLYLDELPITDSDQYSDNQGDSFVYKIGEHKHTRGNIDIDGESYSHGIEAWIARWNYKAESSWAYSVFDLDGKYSSLTGKGVLIKSYNTTNFDTTLEFIGDGKLIDSYHLTPESIPFDINVNVSGINQLKVYVYDNKAVSGGTSFGLTGMILSQITDIDNTNKEDEKHYRDFEIGRDNNSFSHNNKKYGDFYGRTNYSFYDWSHYFELVKNSSQKEKFDILKMMGEKWDGSCYGITLSMALVYANYVSLDDISNNNPECYFNLNPCLDKDTRLNPDTKFSDMIQYYHLSQYIENGGKNAVIAQSCGNKGELFSGISDVIGITTLPSTLKVMVDKAQKNEPYILCYGYNDSEGKAGGHAVLVLGCVDSKTEKNGYDLVVYDCNLRKIEYHYVTISSDYKNFKISNYSYDDKGKIVSSGVKCSQSKFRFLKVVDMENMKNTPVLSPNVANLGRTQKLNLNSAAYSADAENDDNITIISFNANTSFTLKTKSGKTLTYDGDNFSGDLTVLDFDIIGTETPYYSITIGQEDELTFSNDGKAFDVTVYYNGEYYSVSSEGKSKAVINKNGLSLDGKNYDFTAQTGVFVDGEPKLVSVSGNATDKVILSSNDDKPFVKSDHELEDITIASFSPSTSAENKYDTVEPDFVINSDKATVVEIKSKDDSSSKNDNSKTDSKNNSDSNSNPDTSSKPTDSSKSDDSSKPDNKDNMLGDVNGDGEINVTDIAMVAAHIKGIKALDENAVKAANVNGDAEVNVTDIAMIAAHIKGIKAIG